jgi:hypothetical protein
MAQSYTSWEASGGAKYVGNVDIAEGQPLPPPIHPTEASDWWALLAVQ